MPSKVDDMTRLEDIHEQKKADGKVESPVPTLAFLVMLGIVVPFWLSVLVPLTLTYQFYKFLWVSIMGGGSGSTKKKTAPYDTSLPAASEVIPKKDRKYDLVLLGSSGFTGRLAFKYLCQTYGVGGKVKWAIAGRSSQKLEKLKASVSAEVGIDDVKNTDVIVVDTCDRDAVQRLVKDTRVVATTAGPFALYGPNVVEFCAKYGTDYVDITGEVDWSREMIAKWDTVAQKSGAKMIPFCGHDCVPWDLTVYKLTQLLKKECQDDLVAVECLNQVVGGVSGGTIATILLAIDEGAASTPDPDPLVRKADGTTSLYKTKNKNELFLGKAMDPKFPSQWVVPYIMAFINADIVTRSVALRSTGNLVVSYREGWMVPDFKTAFVNTFGLYIAATALLNPITGTFMRKFVLPKPGEGPPDKAMEQSFLIVNGYGVGVQGNKVESIMYFPKDAGYMDTARMLVESGLSLALSADDLPTKGGGFFTPSTGLGDVLLDRLCKTGSMFRYRVAEKK